MTLVIDERESAGAVTLTVKKPDRRYLDLLFRLKCAPDLLALGLFPNAKEWTESCAMHAATRAALGPEAAGDGSVLLTHAHVSLGAVDDCLAHIQAPRALVVAQPCCVKQGPAEASKRWRLLKDRINHAVWSPERRVLVWGAGRVSLESPSIKVRVSNA